MTGWDQRDLLRVLDERFPTYNEARAELTRPVPEPSLLYQARRWLKQQQEQP